MHLLISLAEKLNISRDKTMALTYFQISLYKLLSVQQAFYSGTRLPCLCRAMISSLFDIFPFWAIFLTVKHDTWNKSSPFRYEI